MIKQKLIFEVREYIGSLVLETTFTNYLNEDSREPSTLFVAGTVLAENICVDRCLQEIWVLYNCARMLDIEVRPFDPNDHRYDYLNTNPPAPTPNVNPGTSANV